MALDRTGAMTSADEAASGTGDVESRPALIRVAKELHEEELQAMRGALEGCFGYPLRLEVELDATVIGGAWVRVGSTVIDGSVRGRLEALRDHLGAQCRAMYSADAASVRSEGEAERSV